MEERQDGNIIQRDIEEEMRTAYIDYAMSVIVARALPDVRDGLKPVHRRILYAMHEDGITSDKPYRKCANTVGSVLGRYHPHGDASVYDAMVRMAQDFSMRYMLIDGHGNFGSIDGDGAAAMRYTEARMSKIAEQMLVDIEKNTVDFMPNHDDRLQEPTVLPAKIPALLVNGSSGIAVGMATNIPPHNLTEIINGIIKIIDEITACRNITLEQLHMLLETDDMQAVDYLRKRASEKAHETYGNQVFIRGLIEFTNYCKNDCLYCGIRHSNTHADRYRLSTEQIMACCESGYELGFRTFVLQGGEDPYYTDERICEIVSGIKAKYPDCAVTLSIGEKSKESYQSYFDAGADRYLLRHETADEKHYSRLHPVEMSLENRKQCLWDLKEIGYQVGCGFMVGSPGQTVETLYEDLQFIKELEPHMVGIGPFISQKDTPFANEKSGTMDETLRLLSIIRLIHPKVLLPATTALGTIHPLGREKGIQSGANVVMPNLSPVNVRDKYKLYDNKICTGDEAAECRFCMENRMKSIGYQVVVSRGDYADF